MGYDRMEQYVVICELSYLELVMQKPFPHEKYDFEIRDLSVCKKLLSIVTFSLYITYTSGTLADS